MKRTPMATALRTRCAECIRAMQLVCMCAYAQVCANTCAHFSQNVCVRDDMGHKYERKYRFFMGICIQEDMEVQA